MSLFGTPWDKIEIKRIPGIGDGPDVPGGSKRPRKLIPAAFDPESADADGDGWRQEGTTARWYGLIPSNPIYKNVLSHFKKIKDPDNDTAWLPVGNTTLEEWLGTIDRVENILLKAPPVELSTMEADLSFVAGRIDLKTRQAQARGVDAPNIASESRRAAAWVKGREIQRKRFGKSSEVLSGDDESVLARAEALIDALKRKRVERDKKIAQDFELDDDTKRLARNFDITKFLDSEPDYDEWKRDWEQNNPEPVRGDFATEELHEAALEDWDEQRSFDYEELLMSGNSDQELLDALDDIFSFEVTTESGNQYYFSFQYVQNTSIESVDLHFAIFTSGDREDGLPEGEQIGNGTRTINFYDSKVYNDFFSLEEDVRGEQISTIVGARNEQIFAQMGMREIIVSAASGEEMNGATHWPKVGFDWSDESERDHYIKIIEDALDTFSAEVLDDPDALPTVTAKRNKKTVAVPLFASKEEAEVVLALIEKAKTQRFEDEDRLTAGDLVNWSGAEFWFKKKAVTISLRKELGSAVAPAQVKWLRIESRVKAVKKPNLPNTPKKPSVGGGGPSKPRALKPAVFNPKSVDVDNDGWHQEGTTAAWFGAGLNNPVVQALKQSLGALGDDDKESSYNAMIATGGYGIFEGAPSPEISTPESDLAWLGGKIVLQQQQQGNASRNPLDGPPPRGVSSDSEFKLEAQWLQGRDEARRRGGVREQVVPTPEIEKLDDQTVIEAIDKAITARKERRTILDAKTRVKADDAASDEVKEKAKAFNFEDYPPDDDVELLEMAEWKENYAEAPERNTEYPLGGTQEELDAYNESMRQYLQWSADAWDEYVGYRRTQEALKHAELRNALAEIYEYEFLGNDGKTYSTKLDSAMKNETGSFSMSGKIYNESGEEVGFFDRTFLPDGTTVSHDHMKLEEGTRGSQISGILNSRNEIMYQEMGYETITLGAMSGQDYNGATHWPKLGYDWLDEDQKELGLRAVEDALTEFALAIKENPDALPMMTKVIEDKDDPDISTEVRIPIFASREEAESVALLIAIARDQEFGDSDGLTAGDFVNWSGAELFFQQKGIQIELSRAIGGQKESADVPDVTPDADVSVGRMSVEEIQEKNKKIFEELDSVGGRFGGMDEEYKSLKANDGRPPILTFTKEELTEQRLQYQKNLFKSLRAYFETGERPMGQFQSGEISLVGEEGFDEERPYEPIDMLREFTDRQLSEISPELRQIIMESSDEELDEMVKRAAVKLHEDIDRTQISVQIPVNRIDSVLEDGAYKTTHEVHSNHSDAGTRVRVEAERMGIPRDASSTVRPSSGYIVLGEHVEAGRKAWEEVTPDSADDDRFQEQFSSKNYVMQFAASGVQEIYGDIRVVLKPEVAERTAYSFGDTIVDNPTGVTLLSETDPEVITNTLTRVGGQSDPRHQILKLLHADQTGSSLGVGEYEFDGKVDFSERRLSQDLINGSLEEQVQGRLRSKYFESTTLGGFDLGEVSEVYLPPKARAVSIGQLDETARSAVIDEFLSADALRARGLSEEEIAYVQNILRSRGITRISGSESIERILELRKAKELEGQFSVHGIKVIHQHPMSMNIMDPASYGGQPEDDVEELFVAKATESLYERIKDDYVWSLQPKPEAPTGLDIGALG